MSSGFGSAFVERRKQFSSLCVGIDPSIELLKHWGLSIDVNGLRAFIDIMLDAMGERIAVAKPQSAFFEQFGPDGMAELQRLCELLSERGVLVIVDCKRSDIGHSMEAYARTYLGPNRAYRTDAITLNAYLGFESLRPAIDLAAKFNQAVFVVVSSSNPEGRRLQGATVANQSITELLASDITLENQKQTSPNGEGIGHCGAVCGLSQDRSPSDLLARLPEAPLLVPGLGAQGGTCVSFLQDFADHLHRSIPSVGRSILQSGPDKQRIAEAIDQFRQGLIATKHP